MPTMLYKEVPAVVKAIDRSKRELLLLASHQVVDADGEVIVQAGIDWTRWDLNPQVLSQHDRMVDIGTGLPDSRRIVMREGAPATVVKVRLDSEAVSPEAARLYTKLQSGGTMGVSIGFLPIQTGPPQLPGQTGVTFLKTELMEISLVTLGSCPTCVVLEKSMTGKMVPANVSTALAQIDTAWSAPTLNDFTDKSWGDLSDEEKRHIAGHFAWSDEMPPKTYGSLKLPHHEASSGKVVFRGVAAAAARLNQTQGIDQRAVQAHLAAHYRQFGKPAPWKGLKEDRAMSEFTDPALGNPATMDFIAGHPSCPYQGTSRCLHRPEDGGCDAKLQCGVVQYILGSETHMGEGDGSGPKWFTARAWTDDDVVLELRDEPELKYDIDRSALKAVIQNNARVVCAVLKEKLPFIVEPAVHRAIRKARGRVD